MKTIIACAVIVVGVFLWTTSHAELRKLESVLAHDLKVQTFCIEGHVFVVAISDVGKGGGTAISQIYHEVDGKAVPMKCTEAKRD